MFLTEIQEVLPPSAKKSHVRAILALMLIRVDEILMEKFSISISLFIMYFLFSIYMPASPVGMSALQGIQPCGYHVWGDYRVNKHFI